jgi:hypothetical protein
MRPFRIIALSAGVALGYGFAFHAMRDHHRCRMSFEQHVADLCVDAARKSGAAAPAPTAPRPAE